ncbi:hypothetical protein A2866_04370 [Candidatus Roizmanbacteria bacterium RIFCSPHIGHO2_01_FULL_39_8]|uniref:Uncharacterized protein n=2 Tax=Candidatus Roizmaniibacteriota TaxID=1752723 RepID=A0A1F7GKY3_9BACT|nr:MAG: hypothetical protein A2866_04370 [Candidatus Roizmanbacteria bacterium RIFCSPHIGHO2_01_FULL_39_8]OGK26308.1 MAG: hypothetical protein A3C28_02205 [Candidatus Roizmanbacteria bacterium RIFCSPHIGHO2_02_FULL_39_9]
MVGILEGIVAGATMGGILTPVVLYANQFSNRLDLAEIDDMPSRVRQVLGVVGVGLLSIASGGAGGAVLGGFV